MYFKITNADENHNGYQYTDGLNILNEYQYPEGYHETQDFFILTQDNIFNFLGTGIYLRDVLLPINNSLFRTTTRPDGKIITNMIILGEKRLLSDVSTIEYLLSCGATIDKMIDNPLRWACQNGYFEIVKLLIRKGVDPCVNNNSALRSASYYGHDNIVELLLNNRADVHANNDESIRRACKNGHFAVAKILIEHGANIQAKQNSAFHWASLNSHNGIVDILVENGALSNFIKDH